MNQGKSKSTTEYRKGDEVGTIFDGRLVFGTLEYHNQQVPGEWSVHWNDDIWSTSVPKKRHEGELVLTDRAIYRGCKVRRADKSTTLTGVCRSVTLTADLRIVGTTTILPSVNSTDLSHLKEFKQKSVVCERGWLGVITEVERMAKVRYMSGTVSKVALSDILKTSSHTVESPWVNEGVVCTRDSLRKAKLELAGEDFDETPSQVQKYTAHQRLYIEDIEVTSVKVAWRFQVDLMCPDKPPSTYKGERLKSLKIVREDFCTESTFHVGNLCRYMIRTDSEFRRQDDFEKKLVQEYFPTRLGELNPDFRSSRAYDKDPEARLTPEKSCVVELIHLTGTADIIWQDGTMEFMKSMDLIVLEESLIDNVLIPGDFLFSRELKRKSDDVYAVVQRTDLQKKMVYMKLLTCTSPPKVVDYNLCLPEASVIPHPRYKYFNETNTIAVMNPDPCTPSSSIRVGHVQTTNLVGKVSIRWRDTGKEEWCWPTDCSIFSVKGYDLECIINLVIGEDEVSQDPKSKLQVIINRLSEINGAWKNPKEYDNCYLAQSIVKLKCLISELLSIEANIGQKGEFFSPGNISDTKTQRMTLLSAEHLTEQSDKECLELTQFMDSCTSHLMSECTNALDQLIAASPAPTPAIPSTSTVTTSMSVDSMDVQSPMKSSQSAFPVSATTSEQLMEVDDSAIEADFSDNPSPASSSSSEDFQEQRLAQFPDCFRPNVVVDDCCPEGHTFGKAQFEQQHVRYFIKVVKDELNNLRDSCPPGIKVKAYGDRFDLFSIMICGPMSTPYENTLYLFDASLPTTYPSVPPKFHFHAYGAGRLNPNLYAEGKVCVSLLGTWMGQTQAEKWTKESNLAQVLLSIQALILVNEPYHNEPGLEADKSNEKENRTHCLNYNTALLPKVAQMMVNQIKTPMDPWKEEINSFYKENIPKFIARWKKWLAVAERKATKKAADFDAALSDEDKPGFVIWPINPTLKTSMTAYLTSLETLHKTLCENVPEVKEPEVNLPSTESQSSMDTSDS